MARPPLAGCRRATPSDHQESSKVRPLSGLPGSRAVSRAARGQIGALLRADHGRGFGGPCHLNVCPPRGASACAKSAARESTMHSALNETRYPSISRSEGAPSELQQTSPILAEPPGVRGKSRCRPGYPPNFLRRWQAADSRWDPTSGLVARPGGSSTASVSPTSRSVMSLSADQPAGPAGSTANPL
jgi:hypothetical protein